MAKYKFEDLVIELENPKIINIGNNGFKIGDKTVMVYADLSNGTATMYRVYMGDMENFDGWNDEDLQAFAVAQLETFKVIE
jgi:hypothetical protein